MLYIRKVGTNKLEDVWMKVALIASPYDLGREGVGMGEGPARYLQAGAADSLSERGFEVGVGVVERQGAFEDELSATAEVNADLAKRVGEATQEGAFPLVLGGNCDSSLGVLSGLGPARPGIVWFDAHGDFNTPRTSTSGYLGGMALAVATGNCHEGLWSCVSAGTPVPESRVVMVGVRDVEEEQRPLLQSSGITVVEAARIHRESLAASLRAPLDGLRSQVGKVYLHLDIDSLDPRHAPGVDFPAHGGLSPEEVEEAISLICETFEVSGASLTAFNPEKDEQDRTLRLGMCLMETIVGAVCRSTEKGV